MPLASCQVDQHPAWELYDLYRTTLLNVKYFTCILNRWQLISQLEEWIAFVTTPSAFMFLFWQGNERPIWKVLGIIASMAAISRVVFKFSERIRLYEGCVTEYRILQGEIHKTILELKSTKQFEGTIKNKTKKLIEQRSQIECKVIHHKRDNGLAKKLQDQVNREFPVSEVFIPKR